MLDILKTPEFGQFVVNILVALIAVVVPLMGAAVRSFAKSKANDTTFQILMSVARTAVLAAEQAGLAGTITDKKASAIAAAQAMLADRGINIDLAALDAAIEAAVATELNSPAIVAASYKKAEEVESAA